MARRPLNRAERKLAEPVFRDSLPWDHIRLTDRYGRNGSLYVMGRNVHVGPVHYQGMDSSKNGPELLIHELTHVWQSEHGIPGAYILSSVGASVACLAEQIVTGHSHGSYHYDEGQPWSSYNSEQQAQIVRHWFNTGMDPTDSLYPYVRDHIWTKHYDPRSEGMEKMKW